MLIKRPNRLPGQFHKLFFCFWHFPFAHRLLLRERLRQMRGSTKSQEQVCSLSTTQLNSKIWRLSYFVDAFWQGWVCTLHYCTTKLSKTIIQLFTEKVKLGQNLSLEWSKWIFAPRRIFPLLLFVRHTSLNAISLKSSFYWLVIARVDPDQDPDVDVVYFCLQTAMAPPFCAQVTPGKKQLVFLSRFIVIASASAGFRSSWGLFCLLVWRLHCTMCTF